jgi:hypothetical protein
MRLETSYPRQPWQSCYHEISEILHCKSHLFAHLPPPPHSTHSLQPLDVVMFLPLLAKYFQKLEAHLHLTQGLVLLTKGDFFLLFWEAYNASFIPKNILKSFEVTGISPPDASKVLNRFISPRFLQDMIPKLADVGDGGSLTQLRKLYHLTVEDMSKVPPLHLWEALHSLQVQNELLHHRNKGMKEALIVKRKHAKKSCPLPLKLVQEGDSGAQWWSPGSLARVRAWDVIQRREDKQEKLRRSDEKELKATAALYKKKQKQVAKELRESAAAARKKNAEARAAECAAEKEQRKQERDATTAQKVCNRANKASQTTSQGAVKKSRQGGGALGGASREAAALSPLPPPPRTTMQRRSINLLAKYRK